MGHFNVSIFSILSSLILFNFATIIIIVKRKNTAFIAKYSVNLLLISTLLAFLRLLFPIDLYYAKIIDIHKIYRFLKPFFTFQLFNDFTLYQLLLIIWLLGFFLFGFYYLFISLFEIHKLNKLESINLPVIENLISQYSNRKIIIKVSTTIDIPKVWGFRTCHLYVPDFSLSSEEWKFILAHEIEHIKLHDTFIKVLLLLISAIFWWNPLMYILRKDIDQMLELRCDAKLIERYSKQQQTYYLETLLKVLKQKRASIISNSHNYMTASFVNYSAYSLTRQRFELILDNNHRNKKLIFCYYVLSLLLFIGSYFIILQPAETVDTTNTPTLILHVSDDQYELYVNGKFSKTLNSTDIKTPKYSKYEIIERSQ